VPEADPVKASANRQDLNGWPEQVEAICASRGLQLMPLRRRVLSILGESPNPLGAYAIIDKLSKVEGKQIAPPTVYRTLEFFMEHGFLHKIESRNVFARCGHVGRAHHCVLLVCEKCGHTDEIENTALENFLRRTADRAGFVLHPRMLELRGACKSCTSLDI
jgi:Fur family zinc uptake transcriptional regulator